MQHFIVLSTMRYFCHSELDSESSVFAFACHSERCEESLPLVELTLRTRQYL